MSIIRLDLGSKRRICPYVERGERHRLGSVDDGLVCHFRDGMRRELLSVDCCTSWSYRNHRMNRRDEMAYIAHVSAANYRMIHVWRVNISAKKRRVVRVRTQQ